MDGENYKRFGKKLNPSKRKHVPRSRTARSTLFNVSTAHSDLQIRYRLHQCPEDKFLRVDRKTILKLVRNLQETQTAKNTVGAPTPPAFKTTPKVRGSRQCGVATQTDARASGTGSPGTNPDAGGQTTSGQGAQTVQGGRGRSSRHAALGKLGVPSPEHALGPSPHTIRQKLSPSGSKTYT